MVFIIFNVVCGCIVVSFVISGVVVVVVFDRKAFVGTDSSCFVHVIFVKNVSTGIDTAVDVVGVKVVEVVVDDYVISFLFV